MAQERIKIIEILEDKIKHNKLYLKRLQANLKELKKCKASYLSDGYVYSILKGYKKAINDKRY